MSTAAAPAWDLLARAARRGNEPREEAGLVRDLLCLVAGGEPYALPIERVREIVRLPPITKLPRAPELVLGVISLRGEIFQVLDLRRAVAAACPAPARRARIVVLNGEGGEPTGWLVDAVSEVCRVAESAFQPPPGEAHELVSAVVLRGSRFLSVLDPDRMQGLVNG